MRAAAASAIFCQPVGVWPNHRSVSQPTARRSGLGHGSPDFQVLLALGSFPAPAERHGFPGSWERV
jgi:hypothetical protein